MYPVTLEMDNPLTIDFSMQLEIMYSFFSNNIEWK